ncbi:MAG: caspase family protein [bacterium]
MDISHDEKSVVLKYEKGQMVFASFPQLKKYAESVNPKIDSKPEKGLSSRTHFIEISPNDAFVAVMHFGVVNIFDIKSGKLLTTLSQSTSIGDFSISPDCRYVATSSQFDGIRIWEVKSGKLICTMMCFDDGTWAVVDPQGRYDASNAGDTTGLRWTIGDESVALRQLKDRYYEPNLLAKLMGFNDEPLRPVEGLDTVKLFPTVAVTPPAAGETKLGVSLTNRGGGIGTVLVLVNGKELTGDARGDMPDPTAATATLSVDLAQSAALMPGKENLVEVVAANADGTLTSRSVALTWTAPGAVVTTAPACYALIIGTSDYAGDTLDLRYAARDATAFAQAVQLGADRLFGVAETHLTLLTTDKDGIRPTKVAIQTAFTQIARQANPCDVLLVYIAGHGASLGRGQDTYCYLTCDARSAMDLADPVRRKLVAVTSAELQQWCARIPAMKQVLVLDTCAAGAAADSLLARREITGDQIRAIERLKDRTGLHVLMGCAADAKSYEANRYGQGVLTYALLQGMKGGALRDGQFADVSTLFAYASDQVPVLAANLGGVQRPMVMAPRGNSFDIGAFNIDDRAKIPLSSEKMLVGRPLLLNPATVGDPLNLTSSWQARLRQDADANGKWVWVDSADFPGAVIPQGIYTQEGTKIILRLTLWKAGIPSALAPITGDSADIPTLLNAMEDALAKGIQIQ